MKKVMFFISLVLVAVLMSGCGQASHIKGSANQHKKIIVGLDDHFPPMGFRGDNGDIIGFDIDLAREVLEGLGYEVEFKAVDWDGVLLSLNNKDIDLIWNGMTITEKRKEKIAFSVPYLINSQIIVIDGGSDINRLDQLEGKTVGVQMGSSSEIVLTKNREELGVKEIKKFSNNVDAFMDLKAGRIQAVLVDEVVGRYYISKKGDQYKVIDEDLGGEEYGVGIRKEDRELKEKIDKALKELMEKETFKKIKEKWFGK